MDAARERPVHPPGRVDGNAPLAIHEDTPPPPVNVSVTKRAANPSRSLDWPRAAVIVYVLVALALLLQNEQPDSWLRRPDPWEVVRLDHIVEVKLACSFEIRGGSLVPVPGKPSTLLGIPFDRPVVGYGGQTINTLRLWSAGAPDSFHFHQFSHGDFVGAVTEALAANSITRVLYPDDSTAMGRELRFLQEYFLCACSIHDIVRRFRANNTDWNLFPERSRFR